MSGPPASDPDPVSLAVAEAVRSSGLTQARVAELMGTAQPNVARLARPEYHGHSVATLRRLAEALGMRLEVRFVPDSEGGRGKQ